MSLSKPIMSLVGKYLEQLYIHPIRTRAISSASIAICGNVVSQYLSGCRVLNQDSIIAFGLFGLLFGGTIPHLFYTTLERVISDEVGHSIAKRLLIERLIYSPMYQAFAIYMIARLEGKTHGIAIKQLERTYWPILQVNWKWMSIIQCINLSFVPPILRVLFMNLVGFFWSIYLAHTLRQKQEKRDH
ncbi:uncharacterized protein CBL_00364 [Carabus blaptoides fortunei]